MARIPRASRVARRGRVWAACLIVAGGILAALMVHSPTPQAGGNGRIGSRPSRGGSSSFVDPRGPSQSDGVIRPASAHPWPGPVEGAGTPTPKPTTANSSPDATEPTGATGSTGATPPAQATEPAEATEPQAATGPVVGPTPQAEAEMLVVRSVTLTHGGSDRYRFDTDERSVEVSAPGEATEGSLRIAWWLEGTPVTADHQSCVTWAHASGRLIQPGIALRIRGEGEELRALTVTNNVWAGSRSGWNVHGWIGGRRQILGQVRLEDTFGTAPDPPWRICARVVGLDLSFMAWPLDGHIGEWGDARYSASIRLPAGWDQPGRPGWYVGHMEAGDRTRFTGLGTRPL